MVDDQIIIANSGGRYQLDTDGHIWDFYLGCLVEQKIVTEEYNDDFLGEPSINVYVVNLRLYDEDLCWEWKDWKVSYLLALHFLPNPYREKYVRVSRERLQYESITSCLEWVDRCGYMLSNFKSKNIVTSPFKNILLMNHNLSEDEIIDQKIEDESEQNIQKYEDILSKEKNKKGLLDRILDQLDELNDGQAHLKISIATLLEGQKLTRVYHR